MSFCNPLIFNVLAIAFSACSAGFWAFSARVKIPTGFDVGVEQAAAFDKAGRLNARGAMFAAMTAASLAAAEFIKVVPFCVR